MGGDRVQCESYVILNKDRINKEIKMDVGLVCVCVCVRSELECKWVGE